MKRELSNKNLWRPLSTIEVNKVESFNLYSVNDKQVFSLYAEAYDDKIQLYNAELKDFVFNVHFVVVERLCNGVALEAMQFLTGINAGTIRTAKEVLTKNYLDFYDDLSRAEVVLEHSNIPYVKGIDYITKSYVRSKMKQDAPELKSFMNNKTFKITVMPHDMLLQEMITSSEPKPYKPADKLTEDMFPSGLLEAAVAFED